MHLLRISYGGLDNPHNPCESVNDVCHTNIISSQTCTTLHKIASCRAHLRMVFASIFSVHSNLCRYHWNLAEHFISQHKNRFAFPVTTSFIRLIVELNTADLCSGASMTALPNLMSYLGRRTHYRRSMLANASWEDDTERRFHT